jgi:hypothetical protein
MSFSEVSPLLKNAPPHTHSTSTRRANLNDLPEKLLLKIFSHLDQYDLGVWSTVNRKFQRLASSDKLWSRFAPNMFINHISTISNIKEILRIIQSRKVNSVPEMLKRVKTFLSKIPAGKTGKFRYIEGPNQDQIMTIEISMVDRGLTNTWDIREDWLAPSALSKNHSPPSIAQSAMMHDVRRTGRTNSAFAERFGLGEYANMHDRRDGIGSDEMPFPHQAPLKKGAIYRFTYPVSISDDARIKIQGMLDKKLEPFFPTLDQSD